MFRHNVVFSLTHAAGSTEEAAFLAAARGLAGIPAVERLELFREVNPRTAATFGVTMDLADLDAYRAYTVHPIHVAFVEQQVPFMRDIAEIDLEPLD